MYLIRHLHVIVLHKKRKDNHVEAWFSGATLVLAQTQAIKKAASEETA